MAGDIRDTQGSYLMAFVFAGATGIIAAVLALMIRRSTGSSTDTPEPNTLATS